MDGKREMAEALVAAGARTDITDDKGRTAIDFAREKGHQDLADWLARVDAASGGT
jgi:ankyrin repeat protein